MSNAAIAWAFDQDCPSPGAKFVLVALANMASPKDHACFPGQQKLAELTGQGDRSVRRQLAELESARLLIRERRFDGAGRRTSDRYVLPITTGQSGQWPNRPVVKLATGQSDHWSPAPVLPANLAGPTGQSGQVNQRETKEETTVGRSTASEFAEFWSVYPRHVGRRKAELEYTRAIRRAPADQILAGAKRYRDDPNREPQFTKHPSTWLHQDCWTDDPIPARNAPPPDSPWKKYADER